jgi:DNA primase RepB-like protein
MADVGFRFSSQAIRRQLAAMPNDTYLIRLIHHVTRRPCSGERIWPATQILREPTIRFLRARNREGFDVYFRPYALDHNAGYILVDLDCAQPAVLTAMRDNRHEPCTVIETSPGHLQAWIRVSLVPLPPPLATPISRHLARLYQGDLASADWRHLGRLAGFTNQKHNGACPADCLPGLKSTTPPPAWHPIASSCWSLFCSNRCHFPFAACRQTGLSLSTPLLPVKRRLVSHSRLPRQLRFIKPACTSCEFHGVFPSPIGASQTSGSPNNSFARASLQHG